METAIRVMLSVFLVGLVVMTIVFFSIFGLLPAEKLTQVLNPDKSTSTQPKVIVSTTTVTVVERIVRGGEEEDEENQDQQTDQQPQQNQTQPDSQPSPDQQDQVEEPQEPEPEPTGPTQQDLPPAVFNTSGVITEIGSDYFEVDSDGSHMETIPASGIVPVTVHITDSTNLLNEDNESIGMSDFSVGDQISIESPSNIKNEKEFEGSNIRKTQ